MPSAFGLGQSLIQRPRGANEGNVGKGLRKVAQMLAARPQLFRVETEMIGVAQSLFKDQARLLHIARPRQAFDIPERAHGKRPLVARQSIRRGFGWPVAEYQGVFNESVFYGCHS